MTDSGRSGWLKDGLGGSEEDPLQGKEGREPGQMPAKSVMVYLMDKERRHREPLGIITERRKSERDVNNAIGMLRLARKEFARSEEEAQRIVIGEYV